ncbi:MAG: RNA 2',3'-cyclic phosphodiesterase [Halobacteriales archaeon]
MRLFISIDLPDRFADRIAAVQEELRPASGLNVTDPSQAHLTLKFLGETDTRQSKEVEQALDDAVEEADLHPFEATIGGLGAFPDTDYIRVVWLGFEDGGDRVRRLHEAIEDRTVGLGFEPEEHDFTPHVTIARMEHAGGKELVQQVLREQSPTVGTMTVEEVRLTESKLRPDGPEYSTMSRFPL